MLKKLLKHEWKGVSKIGLILLIAMVVLTAFGCLSFKTPMWSAMFSAGNEEFHIQVADVMSILMLITYYLMIIAVSYGFMIFIAIRFYRTMYTDQGYLAHTLPVTPAQLWFSKIFVSSVWTLIINVVMVISVFAVMGTLIGTMLTASQLDMSIFSDVLWAEILAELKNEMGLDLVHLGISLVALVLASSCTSVIIMFGAVTLGQLSKNNKGIMGFVWYLVISFAQAIITYGVQMVVSVKAAVSTANYETVMGKMYSGIFDSTTVTMIIVAIVMYALGVWINKKKINLI